MVKRRQSKEAESREIGQRAKSSLKLETRRRKSQIEYGLTKLDNLNNWERGFITKLSMRRNVGDLSSTESEIMDRISMKFNTKK